MLAVIISLISQKGGVGKSAVARLLGVEFTKAGWNVKIADLDPVQGTTTRWKARRDQANIQPEIAVEKFRTVERALKEAERFDLLILDGPAHAEQGGRIMARASDLILMPSCYGLDDMEAQVEAAYELEQSGVPGAKIWFVFCRAKGSDAEDRAARDYLRKARINVFVPVFQELPSIRQGHNEGRAASEVPFPKIQERVTALAQAIADLLQAKREAA
jgi:chromosome partitioning protein